MAIDIEEKVQTAYPYFTEEHGMLRDTVREFVTKEIAPHTEEWDEAGIFPRTIFNKARSGPKRIIFAEGEAAKIIRAAAEIEAQGIGEPILLGREDVNSTAVAELGLDYRPRVVDPRESHRAESYARVLFKRRQRKGITMPEAREMARRPNYFGLLALQSGDADATKLPTLRDRENSAETGTMPPNL